MAQKKTRQQLEAENKVLRSAKRAEGGVAVARDLVKWAGIGFVAYCVYLSIDAVAGKYTDASFALGLFGNVTLSMALSWSATAVATIYGVSQKKLRKDTVERLQARISSLEKMLDKKRTSSTLTPRGDTRPEDAP